MFKNMKIRKAKRELKEYIKKMLPKKSREEITELLLSINWDKEMIDEVFDSIENKKKDTIEIKPLIKKITQEEEPKTDGISRPEGIKGRLDNIQDSLDTIMQKEKIEKQLKKKSFKMPRKVKGKLKKLVKLKKVMVLLLQRTRVIQPTLGELKMGMLIVGDLICEGAVECTWLWMGKYPTYIVPEWDLKPISKEGITKMRVKPINAAELYKDAKDNKRTSDAEIIIIRAMEAKENMMLKKKANMKGIIIAVVLAIIGMAILFGGKII